MSAERVPQQRGTPVLLGVVFAAFTLWDFYLGSYGRGVRPFDLLGAATLFVAITASGMSHARDRYRWAPGPIDSLSAIVLLFVLAGLVGAAVNPANVRPTLGVWMGVSVFVVFSCVELSPASLRRLLDRVLVIHMIAFTIQLIAFYAVGVLVNYQAPFGGVPRVFSAIFRPSGLFLEPGAYALVTMLLLVLRARVVPGLDRVTAAALLTVLLSVSLFGVLAVGAYVGARYWRTAWFWAVVGVLFGLAIVYIDVIRALPQMIMILDRLGNLGSDASVNARYANLSTASESRWTSWAFWFGQGLTNNYLGLGSSALGFLMAAVGAVGALAFFTALLLLAMPRARVYVVSGLALGLVVAPLWTTFFWWAWMGLLVNRSVQPQRSNSRGAPSTARHWNRALRAATS